MKKILFTIVLLIFQFQLQSQKIEGVNFMPASKEIGQEFVEPLEELGANWISLVIYQYGKFDGAYDPELGYEAKAQKWGETFDGIEKMIRNAKSSDLKVMLKPSVWFPAYGWPGDFELTKEEEWEIWENGYCDYMLELSSLAEKTGVDLICIATEYKRAIALRPAFWSSLIHEIRAIYSGKLTYAANWDNYDQIPFWDQLDYIGIDAYFPLSDAATPELVKLMESWKSPEKKIANFQKKYDVPVIFTEFGYRSINKATWNQWEVENQKEGFAANHNAQKNGYEAIFESFWKEEWFAGGFLWNWQPYDPVAGGPNDTNYTPQNKPCEALIKKWYSEN